MPVPAPFGSNERHVAALLLGCASTSHATPAKDTNRYNVLFIAPLTGVLILRVVLGKRSDALLARVNAVVATWGHRVIVWGLVLLGGTLVVDAIGWFIGFPVIPIGAGAS